MLPTPRFRSILEQQAYSVIGGGMVAEGEKVEQPDDTVPSAERQAELEAAYQKNVAEGKAPYHSIQLLTRGELRWVLKQRGWRGDTDYDVFVDNGQARLDETNLSGIQLLKVVLGNVNLPQAQLKDAVLWGADLRGAILHGANLHGAVLLSADLRGVVFGTAHLDGADLRWSRMDADTSLDGTSISRFTLLGDVRWADTPLMLVTWHDALRISDEYWAIGQCETGTRPGWKDKTTNDFESAARAYRQLAVALRAQGMNDEVDRYAYRGHLMRREALRWSKRWGKLGFSWFLFLISGYGYRLWRILVTYAAVVLSFTLLYWILGVHSFPHEPGIRALWDSFLVSLSAIHGRTTFEQLGAWSPAAWTAAVESVFGIVIEGVFVAMLIQRFFAR